MPLHLLGKKSWNVYNHANIERVRRDEAAAAAAEEAEEQRMQEFDAARRTAILRGETPPPLPVTSRSASPDEQHGKHRREDGDKPRDWDRAERKAKRKRRGEDDTDHEMRLARAQMEAGPEAKETLAPSLRGGHGEAKRNRAVDISLADERGHINLFPPDAPDSESHVRHSSSQKRRDSDIERGADADAGKGMQFRHAAGYRANGTGTPWYASRSSADSEPQITTAQATNVWGKPDPHRTQRDAARTTSNDPMSFMRKAQTQLKQSERDKEAWDRKRREEIRRLKEDQDEERRRRRRRRSEREERGGSEDSLEGFRLDGGEREESRNGGRHGRDDRRTRDSNRRQHHHHRSRSRSRSRDRHRSRREHGSYRA